MCGVQFILWQGPLNDPDHESGDYDQWCRQPSVRVPRIADVITNPKSAAREQIEYQRTSGGFLLHVSMHACYQATTYTQACSKRVHLYLERMPLSFAAELERLSISMVEPVPFYQPCCGCHGAEMVHYGRKLTALRVLEVLLTGHPRPNAPSWLPGDTSNTVEATVQLIRATAATLRSLAIVSGSLHFNLDHMRPFLADVGKRLHFLSLILPGECAVEDYRGGRTTRPDSNGREHASGRTRQRNRVRTIRSRYLPDTSQPDLKIAV